LSLKPPSPVGQAIGELRRAMVDVMQESPMMRKKPKKKETPETKKCKTELITKNI